MPVSIDKIEAQAPEYVSMVKNIGISLKKQGFEPSDFEAAVVAWLDDSGSTEMDGTYLYTGSEQVMKHTLDLAFAAGLSFDDDGLIPVGRFNSAPYKVGDMTLNNCRNFLGQRSGWGNGGTNYLPMLQRIVADAGYGAVDLYHDPISSQASVQRPSEPRRGFFGRKHSVAPHIEQAVSSGLRVRATAAYPVYAFIITDGEPSDKDATEDYLIRVSQVPIFFQWIGVGPHKFEFLKKLDTMEGRLVDNANFFDSKDAGSDQAAMLELMMGEFPSYYREASKLGLITG